MFDEHSNLFDPARGGFQHLEAQVTLLHDFAGQRDVSGDFRHQSADGGGVPILGEPDAE